MSLIKYLLVILLPCYVAGVLPGPRFKPTKGRIWPKPQQQVKKNTYFVMERGNGTYRVTKPYFTCDILEKGIIRLLHGNLARRQRFLREKQYKQEYYYDKNQRYCKGTIGSRTEFRIELTRKCERYPHLDMDEKYRLAVGERIVLTSASIWGILRGMETFDHLLYYSADYTEIRINSTSVTDFPAYPHRGLLIDTGRHYLLPRTIISIIDAMEMNKMNVLHWHIVDDESFPYQSERLPNLSKKGAFHPSMVYTKRVIKEIIEHARCAGIRVIPEFDAPGHVRSWGEAYPEILTECYDEFDKVVELGSLYPINNTTHIILRQLYQEVTQLFPDKYIHIGGDEVNTQCWLSNLKIHEFKKRYRIKSTRILYVLQSEFMNAVKTMLPPKSKYIIWQEVFDAGVRLPNKTIVQVWKIDSEPIQEMIQVLKSGNRVLFSSSWYLDAITSTWETFYGADPRHMVFNETRTSNKSAGNLLDIIGGEACMWGENVDDTNILGRIWPRASAVAERLWTGANFTSGLTINATLDARRRVEEHACRMRHRGVPAEPPNGPGFCVGPV